MLHKNVLPPLAVRLVVPPAQTVRVPLIVAVRALLSVTAAVAVADALPDWLNVTV